MATERFACEHIQMLVCVSMSDQQRHEELVQVDDLDAAQAHFDLPIHLGHIAITISLCCPRKQGQLEAEQLFTNDGHSLEGSEKARN